MVETCAEQAPVLWLSVLASVVVLASVAEVILVVKLRRYRTYFLFPVGYIVYIDYAMMWGLFLWLPVSR